ncbi:MAG: serine hydrolase [Theionarchaea archaeon]|nr:serine hydrolase [Theionarchaea archaeon]
MGRKFALMMILMLSSSLIISQVTVAQNENWPVLSWIITTPEEQGMNSAKLQEMELYLDNEGWNNVVDSILIVRNGCLVYESYPSTSHNENTTHHMFSCTKSFMSALVGIAIDEGYIDGLDDEVLDFFPDLIIENLDERKQAITIKDLLTMTSGLDWYDQTDYYQMEDSSDWVKYVLDRPMAHDPGTVWNYNTGGTHILSAILNRTCPEGIVEFAESHLFEPLGISGYYWVKDNQGIPIGGTALNLRSRDIAKFGYLYLRNGIWDGEQIISELWVAESTTPVVEMEFDQGHGSGYAYLWWTYTWDGTYAARGSYGQYIIVAPSLDIVVVFTGSGGFTVTTLLTQYIFPAAEYNPQQKFFFIPLIITLVVVVSIGGIFCRKRR